MGVLQRLVVSVVAAAMVAGCSEPVRQRVRLSGSMDPSPSSVPSASESTQPLRIAVASVVSPRETFKNYQDFVRYIGSKTGRPTTLVQRATYRETNDLLRTGQVDLAFVCTLAYVDGAREFGLALLSVPVVRGRAEYYSLLIVRADNPAQSIEDLRGATFAFSDPLSNSGWLAPTYALLRRGETPERFFRRTTFTYSHDNSIQAVSSGLVQAAAVDSLVYDAMVARYPDLGRQLRVIDRYGPYPTPPVVASPTMTTAQRARITEILRDMRGDPEGLAILARLEIDGFVAVDPAAYSEIGDMRDLVDSGSARAPK